MAAGHADSDTTGTNDSVSAQASIVLSAPDAASHVPAAAGSHGGDICDNCPLFEAFRNNLGLKIIRPRLSTCASIHFDAR